MPSAPDDEVYVASSPGTPARPSDCTMPMTPTIAAAAIDSTRHRIACSRVEITDRTMTYSARSFHSTRQQRRSSEETGRCRTAIIASGSTELVTPSATRAISTPSMDGHRIPPLRSRASQRSPIAAPNSAMSASFGRSRGTTEPALMPTMSGVTKISRYAAVAGRAMTHPARPIATTANTAYLILMPASAPIAMIATSRTASSCRRRRAGRTAPAALAIDPVSPGENRRGSCRPATCDSPGARLAS